MFANIAPSDILRSLQRFKVRVSKIPSKDEAAASSGVTINHHLWLAWTLSRSWGARHIPALGRVFEDHMNSDNNHAAQGLLWSLSSKKYKELTGKHRDPLLVDITLRLFLVASTEELSRGWIHVITGLTSHLSIPVSYKTSPS